MIETARSSDAPALAWTVALAFTGTGPLQRVRAAGGFPIHLLTLLGQIHYCTVYHRNHTLVIVIEEVGRRYPLRSLFLAVPVITCMLLAVPAVRRMNALTVTATDYVIWNIAVWTLMLAMITFLITYIVRTRPDRLYTAERVITRWSRLADRKHYQVTQLAARPGSDLGAGIAFAKATIEQHIPETSPWSVVAGSPRLRRLYRTLGLQQLEHRSRPTYALATTTNAAAKHDSTNERLSK